MRRVIIKRSAPPEITKLKLKDRQAYLSISITNPFHYSNNVKFHVKWLEDLFSEYRIVIGDYLNRHNWILEGYENMETYLIKSMKMGSEIAEKYNSFMVGSKKGMIVHWQDLLIDDSFNDENIKIQSEYVNNVKFQTEVKIIIDQYILRRQRRSEIKTVISNEMIEASKDYILEELAVMAVMQNKGYYIQAYYGENINVLKKLINNQIKTNLSLSNGVCLDLVNK